MTSAIELVGLTKSYGRRRGIVDVDVEVREGEVFGFLGPNGAGKTTTIRCLTGVARPTSGSALVFGLDAWRDAVVVHRRMASVGSDPGYLGELTAAELLDHLARLRGLRAGCLATVRRAAGARSVRPAPEAIAGQPPEGRRRGRVHGRGAAPRDGRAVERPRPPHAARVPRAGRRGALPPGGRSSSPPTTSSRPSAHATASGSSGTAFCARSPRSRTSSRPTRAR